MADKKIRIGVVAPARRIEPEMASKVSDFAATRYRAEAVELAFHPQCFLSDGHFAGPDTARAEAFLETANDETLDAVWFARGGYGSCRLPETLFPQLGAAARAKTYLGYSDTGALLARLYRDRIGTLAHGPMPADITRDGGEAAIARALDFLTGNTASAATLEPSSTRPGHYAAFNMALLTSLCGTSWMPDLTDHVLMLEDVGEYTYAIDRMMFTLTSNPNIRKVAGIRLGRVSDVPENDAPTLSATAEDIVKDWCARAAIPYLGRADIGHDADNKIVVFGKAR